MRRLFPFLLLPCWFAGAAAAQEPAPDGPEPDVAEARALFDEGTRFHESDRFELAARAFQRCYDLLAAADHPRAALVLYNIGASLDEVPGREREARDAYRRYLDEATIDDADQRRRVEARVHILDDELQRVGASEPGARGISPVGPVLMGVGGVAAVVGGILGAVGFFQGQDLLEECPTAMDCSPSLRPAEESARTIATVGDVLWISGAVVAAAGLVLTLVLTEEPESGEQVAIELRGALGGGVVGARVEL